jgi:hypothetical protein
MMLTKYEAQIIKLVMEGTLHAVQVETMINLRTGPDRLMGVPRSASTMRNSENVSIDSYNSATFFVS